MRSRIEQGLVNTIKVRRALIRLKHSIAADNEINEKLDKVKADYLKSVQKGELPTPINIDKALDA